MNLNIIIKITTLNQKTQNVRESSFKIYPNPKCNIQHFCISIKSKSIGMRDYRLNKSIFIKDKKSLKTNLLRLNEGLFVDENFKSKLLKSSIHTPNFIKIRIKTC